MDHYEMVEKLRAKANVSYEEAKAALEASDWDILDALVLLENEGKVNGAQGEYTTQQKAPDAQQTSRAQVKADFSDGLKKMWELLKKLIQTGNSNQLVVSRRNKNLPSQPLEELFAMPITVMALLLLILWPYLLIVLVVLFASLFLGARYSFRGPDIKSNVNDFMGRGQDKAASAVEIHVNDHENKVE